MNRKRDEYARHSRRITRGPRWRALRMQALERDGWQCVQCGTRHRLEVDHVQPVRTHPELAHALSNLQCLCGRCHARKTRLEVGHKPLSPERQQWRELLQDMQRNPSSKKETSCLIL